MRLILALLILSGCDSAVSKSDPVVYHERAAYTSGAVTTVIDRTHEIRDGQIATWRLAGTRITIDGAGIHEEPLTVHERPLHQRSGSEYRALDTGACYDIQATPDKLTITDCDPSPFHPSIIVEAYP